MTVVELNKNEVLRLAGRRLSDRELEEQIPRIGVSLERLTKETITIEVMPNRPDVLSEPGFARALASFLGIKPGLRAYKVQKGNFRVIVDKNLKNIRPYTACAVAKNLRLDDKKIKDIINLQEKLHITFCRNRKKAAIGIYPAEKITWPIKFKAMKPADINFEPLDGRRAMTGYELLEQHPKGIEYGHLLKGLKHFPVFIDAADKILSVPPIINSEDVGKITESTRDVFVEVSGLDLEYQKLCLNIVVTALADLGGAIYSVDVVYNKAIRMPDLMPREMILDLKYAERMLGISFSQKDAAKLLGRMGYGFKNGKALAPCYRTDVLHQIDLVEDLAIAYGYDKFKPEIPNVATVGNENTFNKFVTKSATILVGLSLTEVSTYHLSSKEQQQCFSNHIVEIENSISSDYHVLRASLLPNLLNVLKSNKHHEYPQRIFEIGGVFAEKKEEDRLAVALSAADMNFTMIKQIADAFLYSLGLHPTYKEADKKYFVTGRTASILINNHVIGALGEIHPATLGQFELEMPVAALEIDMEGLFDLLN